MLIENKGNILVPEYLNEQFFIDTLEEGLREMHIKVHEVNFEWGSVPGENYCSSIYRVLVKYERKHLSANENLSKEEQISLIVKTIPITPQSQFLEDVAVYIKEKLFYTDVLMRLEILTKGEVFAAKYFYGIKLPIQTIVFSDLKLQGFSVASRENQLDWPHAELMLRQLGKFHAASMVLAKKDPSFIERFGSGMLSSATIKQSEHFENMFNGSLKFVIELCQQWIGFEEIAKKLDYYSKNFKETTSKFSSAKTSDRFCVLNHGDLWTNNFMYAYDNAAEPQKPTRIIFVDFQLSFFGSPGCDLQFFFNSSVPLSLLKTHRNKMIHVYHQSLVDTLKYMRYEQLPTLEDLEFELHQRELYGLFALYGFLPVVTMPKTLSENSTLETLADKDFRRKKLEQVFAQPRLQAHLQYALKRLEQLGVLDELLHA